MDFNKIAQDMMELQNKLEVYKTRNKKVKNLLTSQVKEVMKIEKKVKVEKDDFNKLMLQIKLLFAKDTLKKIENIYIEASEDIGLRMKEKGDIKNDTV